MNAPAVRLADYRDESEIYSLLMELRSTGSVAQMLPMSPGKVMAQIECGTRPNPKTRTLIQDDRRGLIGVIGEPWERLSASIGLFFNEPWYSDVPTLTQLWLYVRQESRGQGLDRLLFDWHIGWAYKEMGRRIAEAARERGEDPQPFFLETTHISGDRVDLKDKLWVRYGKKYGIQRIGSVFIVGPFNDGR